MRYIVMFEKKVHGDYHGFYRQVYFTLRFSNLKTAELAAIIYTRNQPAKPFQKTATVFNGDVIVCPIHCAYIPAVLFNSYSINPHLNYVIC